MKKILNYFDKFPSPRRERIISFWTILVPMLLIILGSMLFSSCSPAYMCPTYQGSTASRHH